MQSSRLQKNSFDWGRPLMLGLIGQEMVPTFQQTQKLKKAQYIKNGGFYQKSAQNKKDVKSNFPSDGIIRF